MALHIIYLPINDYEDAQLLQHRILSYEITPEQATHEMRELLAPHVTIMPGPDDQVELRLRPATRSFLTDSLD